MRRFFAISAMLCVLGGFILGCGRTGAPKNDDKTITQPIVKVDPPKVNPKEKEPGPVVVDENQEKYDAALDAAIPLLRDKNWAEALKALETAKGFKDTDFVQTQIAVLKQRIDQEANAKSTIKNIETILSDGNADEADKLSADALRDFGDGDDGPKLLQLSLQADALKGVEKKENPDARFARLRKMADNALAEKPYQNLRTAVLALELALQVREDPELLKTHKELYDRLDTYDALRKKAAESRREAALLDDALAALKDAQAAWDTLQVRTEIDDCQLALAKRRETVSVANFELRNEVGMPLIGVTLADEILPKLKAKYDLVERNQVKRVLDDLKLQEGLPDDLKQRQEISDLTKVRYLVVGSVGRRTGITVMARLIDLRTGLVVQTAKAIVPNIDDEGSIERLADSVAAQLLMTDDERMKFEVAAQGAKVVAPAPIKGLPDVDGAAPMPIVQAAPPRFGDVDQGKEKEVFKVLAPPPANFVPEPQPQPLVGERHNRLLFATVEMGDYLFRAGRFNDAQRQFEFALVLAPNDVQVQLRLQRVRPLVPPLVIVDPAPGYIARPRIAVLPFLVVGNLPGSLGYWTPTHLSPYFATRYEVVDPGEIYWYMGRMGITMRDLLVDPVARRWLGRAVGVRYFVFGNCIDSNSFDVNTYLVDAEFGFLQGSGHVHVRNTFELKFRLGELANLTMLSPADRLALQAELARQQYGNLVATGRRHMLERRFRPAADEFDKALRIYPADLQVRSWLDECVMQLRFQDAVNANQQRFLAQKAAQDAQRLRQAQLAKQAEQTRRQTLVIAAARTDADRNTQLKFRFEARDSLVTRAQVALKTDRVGISVSLFQGAMDIGRAPVPVGAPAPVPVPPTVYDNFAQARLKAEAREAKLVADKEAAVRQIREQQLKDAEIQLAKERAEAQKKLDAARLANLKRDAEAYRSGFEQGQRYFGEKKYEAALAAFQGAQRVAHSPKEAEAVNREIEKIVQQQALASAKGEDDRKLLAAKLDAERQKRKLDEQKYQLALKAAQVALAEKNLAVAQTKFEEAQQVFKTEAVAAGLKQVQAARTAELAKVDAAQKMAALVKSLVADGRAALDAKNYAVAAAKFQQARKLAPQDVEVRAGLAQAEAGLTRPKIDPVDPGKGKLQDLLAAAQNAFKLKNYDEAEKALRSAALIDAKNPFVVKGLNDIAQARQTIADAKQRQADYQAAFGAGQKSLQVKNYADAIKSFQLALKAMPNDPSALKLLQQAQDAQTAAGAAAANFQKAMAAGQTAYKLKKYDEAVAAFGAAVKLDPNDAQARQFLQQAQTAQAQAAGAANFQRTMDAGEAALKLKKYDEAIKAFNAAIKLEPKDQRARKLLQQAQQALLDQEAQAKAAAVADANYLKAMTSGQTAMTAKNYPAAVTAFKDALKWHPNDQKATIQLQAAQKALDASKMKPPPPDPNKQYNEAMQRGSAADKEKKYSDAVKAYNEALNLRPNDKEALAARRVSQYYVHVQQGQTYLDSSMWMAAQTEFEAALKLFPQSDQAKKLLQKAKAKMK